MRTVNVLEAKTHLSALLAEVEAGGEVVIARAGVPVTPANNRAQRATLHVL
jgi:antitoxin (DNA-binding transcriptional repressor) of toxin-antitoxin stability system